MLASNNTALAHYLFDEITHITNYEESLILVTKKQKNQNMAEAK